MMTCVTNYAIRTRHYGFVVMYDILDMSRLHVRLTITRVDIDDGQFILALVSISVLFCYVSNEFF